MGQYRSGHNFGLRWKCSLKYVFVVTIITMIPVYLIFYSHVNRYVYKMKVSSNHNLIVNQRPVLANTTGNGTVKTKRQEHGDDDKIKLLLQIFHQWKETKQVDCGGKFEGYGREVALFRDVIMDTSRAEGRPGGEDFTLLWNQKENDEYYKFSLGFLEMNCKHVPKYVFSYGNHVSQWMNALIVSQSRHFDRQENTYWIGVTRYEYVNLYHTMTDWFNAFFVMTLFNLTRKNTNILIIDGHPSGSLDSVWGVIFNSTLRIGQLPKRTLFKTFIAGMIGYHSLIFTNAAHLKEDPVPILEEFRDFFLSSYDLSPNRVLNCSSLSLLIIWRRPYLAHPRNPSGDVHRKVKNEQEVMDKLKLHFPHFRLHGIQADSLSMREQLRYVSDSDVLIGMHGAGLTLCLMLPRHGALLEFMPNYVIPSFKTHFKGIAKQRGLIYRQWINHDPNNEFEDHFTRLPPDMVIGQVKGIYGAMCSNNTRHKWCNFPINNDCYFIFLLNSNNDCAYPIYLQPFNRFPYVRSKWWWASVHCKCQDFFNTSHLFLTPTSSIGIHSYYSVIIKHDDVIKWKHFPRYWPFVPAIHRSLVNSLHKGQWHGALMLSLI